MRMPRAWEKSESMRWPSSMRSYCTLLLNDKTGGGLVEFMIFLAPFFLRTLLFISFLWINKRNVILEISKVSRYKSRFIFEVEKIIFKN